MGKLLNVVNDFVPGSVSIINVATNAIIGNVIDPNSTFNNPIWIAITPDGKTAYVVNDFVPGSYKYY